MAWAIEYYNESLEKAILSLPDGLLARYLRLSDLMLEFGPNLGMPHTKAMHNGLFELRLKSKEGIARVFYCTVIFKVSGSLPSLSQNSRPVKLEGRSLAFRSNYFPHQLW